MSIVVFQISTTKHWEYTSLGVFITAVGHIIYLMGAYIQVINDAIITRNDIIGTLFTISITSFRNTNTKNNG